MVDLPYMTSNNIDRLQGPQEPSPLHRYTEEEYRNREAVVLLGNFEIADGASIEEDEEQLLDIEAFNIFDNMDVDDWVFNVLFDNDVAIEFAGLAPLALPPLEPWLFEGEPLVSEHQSLEEAPRIVLVDNEVFVNQINEANARQLIEDDVGTLNDLKNMIVGDLEVDGAFDDQVDLEVTGSAPAVVHPLALDHGRLDEQPLVQEHQPFREEPLALERRLIEEENVVLVGNENLVNRNNEDIVINVGIEILAKGPFDIESIRGATIQNDLFHQFWLAYCYYLRPFYYAAGTKVERYLCKQRMIEFVHRHGGRFIKKIETNPVRYRELTRMEALAKCAHTITGNQRDIIVMYPFTVVAVEPAFANPPPRQHPPRQRRVRAAVGVDAMPQPQDQQQQQQQQVMQEPQPEQNGLQVVHLQTEHRRRRPVFDHQVEQILLPPQRPHFEEQRILQADNVIFNMEVENVAHGDFEEDWDGFLLFDGLDDFLLEDFDIYDA
jgi:hypothetical protein